MANNKSSFFKTLDVKGTSSNNPKASLAMAKQSSAQTDLMKNPIKMSCCTVNKREQEIGFNLDETQPIMNAN